MGWHRVSVWCEERAPWSSSWEQRHLCLLFLPLFLTRAILTCSSLATSLLRHRSVVSPARATLYWWRWPWFSLHPMCCSLPPLRKTPLPRTPARPDPQIPRPSTGAVVGIPLLRSPAPSTAFHQLPAPPTPIN